MEYLYFLLAILVALLLGWAIIAILLNQEGRGKPTFQVNDLTRESLRRVSERMQAEREAADAGRRRRREPTGQTTPPPNTEGARSARARREQPRPTIDFGDLIRNIRLEDEKRDE